MPFGKPRRALIGKRDHRVDPGRGHQEPRTTILAGSGSRALLQLLASLEQRARDPMALLIAS